MTTVTYSIHIDIAPETVFDRIVDPTIVPLGIVMEPVNDATGVTATSMSGPSGLGDTRLR